MAGRANQHRPTPESFLALPQHSLFLADARFALHSVTTFRLSDALQTTVLPILHCITRSALASRLKKYVGLSFPLCYGLFKLSCNLDPHIIKGERPFFPIFTGLASPNPPLELAQPWIHVWRACFGGPPFQALPLRRNTDTSPIGARIPDPDQLTWRGRIRGRHQAWAELKAA